MRWEADDDKSREWQDDKGVPGRAGCAGGGEQDGGVLVDLQEVDEQEHCLRVQALNCFCTILLVLFLQ